MSDHPTDDFDERLRSAARDYNRPGDTPRERMWTEVRAARARRASTPAQPTRRRPIWLLPLAAAAILVIGVLVGRGYDSWRQDQQTHIATGPAPVPVQPVPSIEPTTPIDSVRPSPRPERRAPDNIAPNASRPQPFYDNSTTMAYRLAVVEHLAGTEAMLTSFRGAARRGEVDAQITAWAKNLLTTTRLLQASAAQEDPTMKRLLDDLELVLVQIAQYTSTGAHHAEELELIEHSIERRGVIGKLHTTIPARLSPAGT